MSGLITPADHLAAAIEIAVKHGGRIAAALEIAVKHGGHDGEHHKAWVIDQMVRVLAGDRYAGIVRAACMGVDGPETYRWDVGIAP